MRRIAVGFFLREVLGCKPRRQQVLRGDREKRVRDAARLAESYSRAEKRLREERGGVRAVLESGSHFGIRCFDDANFGKIGAGLRYPSAQRRDRWPFFNAGMTTV